MTQQNLDANQTKLVELFSNVFPSLTKDSFNLDQDRTTFENWDSLSHMQLVSEIEQSFNVSFEMEEIVDISKPADFLALITKKKAQA